MDVTKVIVKHEGVQIAELSVEVRVSENMHPREAVQLIAGGHVSLEVTEETKQVFINSTNFACVVLQALQDERVRCVPPSTSATPG
jgi:hypothetical protein